MLRSRAGSLHLRQTARKSSCVQLLPGLHSRFGVDMTSGHILFVGQDVCARVRVLEHMGYSVATCPCEADALRQALAAGDVDAVLFQCTPEPPSGMLLGTCRLLTSVPIVLFADRTSQFRLHDYDAVVPNLCDPQEWVSKIGKVIAAHRQPDRAKPPRADASSNGNSGAMCKTGTQR